MKKRNLLLLFVFSPFVICAMENDFLSSFPLLRSYLPVLRSDTFAQTTSQVCLSPMQRIQANKDAFKKLLYVSSWSQKADSYKHPAVWRTYLENIINNKPVEFLLYCYNQPLHGRNFGFYPDNFLLNKVREAFINGYSALGAAIIAEDTYDDKLVPIKPRFIQRLIRYGFELTEKDRMLVALEFFDNIPAQTMILLLNDKQKGDFSVLPHDVKRSIVDYTVRLFKKEHWLCVLFQDVL